MKKYIDQEAVIHLIETEGYNEKYDLGHPKDNDWFCEEVNRIPAADVRKAVSGKWIDHQEGRWIYAKCSECGTVHDVKSNFCPNCGAKMDGGAVDDNL